MTCLTSISLALVMQPILTPTIGADDHISNDSLPTCKANRRRMRSAFHIRYITAKANVHAQADCFFVKDPLIVDAMNGAGKTSAQHGRLWHKVVPTID